MKIYFTNLRIMTPHFCECKGIQFLLIYKSIFNFNTILAKNSLFKALFLKYSQLKVLFYKVPLNSCSLSIDSNNALKLPAPNPLAPIR